MRSVILPIAARKIPVNSLLLRGHFTRYLRASLPQSHIILSTNHRTCMVKLRKNILIFNHLQMGNSKYFQKTLKSRSLTSFVYFCCSLWPLYCFVLYSLAYCASRLHKAKQGRAFYPISSPKSLWHQNNQLKLHSPPVNFLCLTLVRELQDYRSYGGNYCK